MGLDIYAGIRRFSQSIDEAKERLRMARASALSRTTAMVTRIALLRLYVAVYCKTVAVKVVQNTQISDTGGRVSISKGYSHPDYPDMDYSLVIGPIGMFMRACNGSFKAAAACGNITVQSDESHPVRNPLANPETRFQRKLDPKAPDDSAPFRSRNVLRKHQEMT